MEKNGIGNDGWKKVVPQVQGVVDILSVMEGEGEKKKERKVKVYKTITEVRQFNGLKARTEDNHELEVGRSIFVEDGDDLDRLRRLVGRLPVGRKLYRKDITPRFLGR